MESRAARDSDELLRMIQEDELEDEVSTQSVMAINSYARARGIAPQRVHYYIRRGKLSKRLCDCGRFVVEVAAADAIFNPKNDYDKDENEVEGDEQ